MVPKELNDWLQVVGMVAVIASLIFVGFEIRQDQNLARAELASQSFQSVVMLRLTLSNPDFAKSYATMLDRPEDLTIEEALQVDSLLAGVKNLFTRECYLMERGVFAECDGIVRNLAPTYFGSEYAQSWWEKNRSPAQDTYLPDWINAEIERVAPDLGDR